MGSIGVRDKIQIHKDRERAAVVLIRQAVKTKRWDEAGRYCQLATFHRQVWTELSTVNTRKK